MDIVLITGSAGLIGSEAVALFSDKFDVIVGVDNNLRQYFFGQDASTNWKRKRLQDQYDNYRHYQIDIRSVEELKIIFEEYGADIKLVLHTAAQPSHDWVDLQQYSGDFLGSH